MNNPVSNTIQYVDLSKIKPELKGFSGSCTLGEYVYLSPLMNGPGQFHGNVVRVHVENWEIIHHCNVTNWFPDARGYVDAFSDDRYVYFIPYCNHEHHGRLLRFDSTGPFDKKESWCVVDLQALVHPQAKGFISGSIDGQYLYLAPYQSSWMQHHGLALRYTLRGPLNDPESWEYFDMADLHPDARGYHSAVCTDGTTWFVPYVSENRIYHGHLTSFRSEGNTSFKDAKHWNHFDLTGVHPLANGYVGGCVHRNSLYLAPYYNGLERHGLALKYDISGSTDSISAWEYFDMTMIHADLRGFFGAVEHNGYIYFLPHCKEEGVYHGTLVRYSIAGSFTDPFSWSYLDTTTFNPLSKGFMGCSLIQNTLMLIPYETQTMVHSGLICFIDLEHTEFTQPRTPLS